MTYLECINRVLRRLRENEVTTINETPYSKLIGDLVNVVKVEIEDAWDWSALRTTISATTTISLFNYVLIDSGTRLRILDVINDTDNFIMQQRGTKWFDRQFLLNNQQLGSPLYFNFNGVTSSGDSQVDFFPIPDGVYDIRLNVIQPQQELTLDSDIIQIPATLLVEGALARAISERGDDGGYAEQEQRYRTMASDLIAVESSQRLDEMIWSAC
ncbi:hypothetical protein UFOVP22_7 [uncultured Caudovirales phage]|uniref:Uncharacterized protein n=1 Tax=uncultured Caudovirales phage TaxID=2100421 RepID=A0A6J5T8B1_9CAUD|nr:hypothetical protein UFOVP22_7 [uncultured Caudovirales phage]